MNWDGARKALYDALAAGWSGHPTVEIFRSGQALPDLATRTAPFLTIKVVPRRARQMGMSGGATKPKRCSGALEIYLYCPEKLGDKILLDPLETLENLFTATSIGDIVLGEAAMPRPSTAVGWTRQAFLVAFYYDKL